jgi:glyoxylase-like metal-dependent hydrolase (beta-lactamase superfamily II)
MQIAQHCFALIGFAYIPPWSVNAGFIVGDEKTLIVDSGPNTLAAATIRGYAQAVRPSNQLLLINTERHLDHISGNSHFADHGVEVYGHVGIQRQDSELKSDIDEYIACTPNVIRREQQEAAIVFTDTRIVNPVHKISSEIKFNLGNLNAEVLVTPGHTPTNLCVFVPAERVLFCGDSVVSGYLPNLEGGSVRDWQQWLSTLDRITELEAEVMVCGHGPVLQGANVPKEIQRIRTIIERAILEEKAPTEYELEK